MSLSASLPLETELARVARAIEGTLDELLPKPRGAEARLHEAMRYAALAEGRRLRGFLAVESGRLLGVDERAMLRVAAAIECLHTRALLHEDLPALDDNDNRRKQPATHKAFDEATAILAGNALMTLAISILVSQRTCADPFIRCTLAARMADAAGHTGLVGGEMIGRSAGEAITDIGTLTRLQRMKTGSLIALSCESGAIMARAGDDLVQALNGYAHDLGLALQIVDELEQTGGAAPSEPGANASFVSILGPERARSQAGLLAQQAVRHLDLFDEKAKPMRDVASFVVQGRL